MDTDRLKQLLEGVKNGEVNIDEALGRLRHLPYEDMGFAKLDLHRGLRTGFPEVVFCQGKSCEQTVEIIKKLAHRNGQVIATRISPEHAECVMTEVEGCTHHKLARMITFGSASKHADDSKYVMVLCAGTADTPVAEEAVITAQMLGSRVEKSYDVGVAGLHRLLDQKDKIMQANVVVVVAGMEGALASVVGGLVSSPVVAVPTSVGYGASFDGLAALLAMLNSCAAGVAVMNIDNGFGAGYFAHLVNK